MHVRVNKVRKGEKTYRYVQLVESYRRPDGMPATRVVASLGDLDEDQTETVRVFATALGRHVRLLLPEDAPPSNDVVVRVERNLEYLPLAVLLDVWERSGLAALVRRTLKDPDRDVPTADVIAALVLHRSVAAGSKAAAVRWFPETALPELFGWAPDKFNNSRLHRALEALESADTMLQDELPGVLREKYGAFTTLLIDATDTWFEGRGPEMASLGRIKDGTYRLKILVVVTCDARGLPVRWKTYEGSKSEVHALQEMAAEVAARPWVQEAPLIVDRALGNQVSIEQLAQSGRKYLVAVPESEIPAWMPGFEGFGLDVDPGGGEIAAARLGFRRIDERTYVTEGAVSKLQGAEPDSAPTVEDPSPAQEPARGVGRNADVLESIARTAHLTGRAAAASLGWSTSQVAKVRKLLALPDDVRGRISRGEAAASPLVDLVALLGLADADATRAAFDRLALVGGEPRRERRPAAISPTPAAPQRLPFGRPVLYFNPEMFDDQRTKAAALLVEVRQEIGELNGRLAKRPCNADTARLRADRILRHHGVATLFAIDVEEADRTPTIALSFNENVWAKRRRFDGCCLLVGHLDLDGPAEHLIALYRSRNSIEEAFRTMKSVVELRPVHHRTDHKVRAHVSLCALALLLRRLLALHLVEAGVDVSESTALELFAACHLNRVSTGGKQHHTVTSVDHETRTLVEKLGRPDLIRDENVLARIVCR